MNINKSIFSGHNCEHFFVKIFGAIENILNKVKMVKTEVNGQG